MSLTHNAVVARWMTGKSGNGFNMSTDGDILKSYAMIIGRTLPTGEKQVLLVNGVHNYSVSTAKHVSLAGRKAHCSMLPVYHESGAPRYNWRYFQPNNTREIIRVTSQEFKTERGAKSHLAKHYDVTRYFVDKFVNNWTICCFQDVDSNGLATIFKFAE